MRPKTKILKTIKDLKYDDANVNAGTERGSQIIDWSLTELGAGRSIVADADGNVIAGDKTLKAAANHQLPIRVIETDGSELVVVQRRDLRLKGKGKERERARKLAIADNRASEVSYHINVEQLVEHSMSIDLSALYSQDELDALIRSIEPVDMDALNKLFTSDEDSSDEEIEKIVLKYNPEQAALVREELLKRGKTCEAAVLKLLGL